MPLGFFATPRESIKSGKLILLYHIPSNSSVFAPSLTFAKMHQNGPFMDDWQRDIGFESGGIGFLSLIADFYPDIL